MKKIKVCLLGIIGILCNVSVWSYGIEKEEKNLVSSEPSTVLNKIGWSQYGNTIGISSLSRFRNDQKGETYIVGRNRESEVGMKSSYALGDVNNDRQVDVSDIASVMAIIMGNSAEGFSEKAADLNGDGRIDVSDIAALVDLILEGPGDAGGSGSDMPWG